MYRGAAERVSLTVCRPANTKTPSLYVQFCVGQIICGPEICHRGQKNNISIYTVALEILLNGNTVCECDWLSVSTCWPCDRPASCPRCTLRGRLRPPPPRDPDNDKQKSVDGNNVWLPILTCDVSNTEQERIKVSLATGCRASSWSPITILRRV